MVRRFHGWAGLLLGLPITLLTLSGSGLVYRESLERATSAPSARIDPRGRQALGLEETLTRVRGQNPGFRPTYIQIPPGANAPLEIVLTSGRETRFVAVDPFTGEVLGLLGGGAPSPIEPVRRLHANLLLGGAGRTVLGALAILLVALGVSGIVLFLRHPRAWHARLGLAAAVPLLFAGVSGALLIWARVPSQPAPTTGAAPAVSLDQYAEAARGALPGATLSWIAVGDPVTVRLRLPADWQRRGSNEVHLHPGTAEVLRVDRFADAPLARKFFVAWTAIHYGEWGGALGRLLWAGAGAMTGLLWLTGSVLFFSQRAREG